tara:strand:+ start:390 stop:1466 length:1077 start_codon:yes stop_codon:yes gene_type:complete
MKNPSRFTLGDHRDFTLTEAREKALEFKRMIKDKVDPLAERATKTAEAISARLETTDKLITEFNERCMEVNRTGPEQASMMNNDVLPHWKGRSIKSINRNDVRSVVLEKKKKAEIRANRLLTLLKSFFNWAMKEGYIQENPAKDIEPVTKEYPRDRVLDEDELQKVWQASEQVGGLFGSIIQLLILSGQRRDEVAGMRWSEINADKMLWVIPVARTKTESEHTLPLTSTMLGIIQSQKKIEGSDFVFPSSRSPMTNHASGFSKAKKRIDRLCGFDDWVFHDLRRTAATHMAASNVPIHVGEAILNHRSGKLTPMAKIYNKYDYLKESRIALEALDHLVLSIRLGEVPQDNVVGISQAG